ncbi:hypothetical protein B5F10_15085 [Anaerotruncus colihominis]|uniref:Uncharacterized protein n=2 Tax=Anaerotruncus colihominis TaxID=169435 RepID=B0PBM4_9FIRM|nr:hypothetical protein ANACOL_02182 [Anaerotruncus colihominis DSM 17241]OUP68155.1 hypothetical protein B5F11_14635 [Anaerotruncus colihominis]OUP72430.1 hypothetical protein B5F10_15085 [Anaerotruncus colihominis]RGE65783.1 hypothetical protein DXC40_16155 [Anaerotruncus colihominis]
MKADFSADKTKNAGCPSGLHNFFVTDSGIKRRCFGCGGFVNRPIKGRLYTHRLFAPHTPGGLQNFFLQRCFGGFTRFSAFVIL